MFTTIFLIIGALTVLYWVLSVFAAMFVLSSQSSAPSVHSDYADYHARGHAHTRALWEDDH